jgi:hypothetical protein
MLDNFGKHVQQVGIPMRTWSKKKTTESDSSSSSSSSSSIWCAQGTFMPRAWKMPDTMGNLRAEKKIQMIHQPVTDLQRSPVNIKYLATLRVFLLATTEGNANAGGKEFNLDDNYNYTIIGAVRSPAFAFGSARSLRGRSKLGTGSQTVLDDMYLSLYPEKMDEKAKAKQFMYEVPYQAYQVSPQAQIHARNQAQNQAQNPIKVTDQAPNIPAVERQVLRNSLETLSAAVLELDRSSQSTPTGSLVVEPPTRSSSSDDILI